MATAHEKLLELSRRRGELRSRITVQREQLADAGTEWNAPLALADQGVAAVGFLRRYPWLVVTAAALLVVRRRSAAGVMWGVWRLWKRYRHLASIAAKS